VSLITLIVALVGAADGNWLLAGIAGVLTVALLFAPERGEGWKFEVQFKDEERS